MNKTQKTLLLILLFIFAVTATFFITYSAAGGVYEALERAEMTAIERKTQEIRQYIDTYYIGDSDERAMADAAAAGMVAAGCDEWSYYLSADDYAAYLEDFNNEYVGIGVSIVKADKGIRISEVAKGAPADLAEVHVDDILTHVDGVSVLELGVEGTQAAVRGEIGTAVRLTFLRGDEVLEKEIVRGGIPTPVADCELLDGDVGYIHIYNFDKRCADETLACIDKMLGAGAKSLLFDVRFNVGGLKDEMIRILDRLLPEGALFQSEDYAGKKSIEYSDAAHLDIPMAVLINEHSYSAAEFFAAVLHQYDAAKLVGMPTGGKGRYLVGYPLSDGSYLNLSIGTYYLPDGTSLSEGGVLPDIEQDLSDEAYANLYYGALAKKDDA
ncbi:MAG: PDZ domain-containing protein, partial [Oscillospiraceae bacterium]|nr:PDZ domain-containing protein [Oscillospiraceae bacterium]